MNANSCSDYRKEAMESLLTAGQVAEYDDLRGCELPSLDELSWESRSELAEAIVRQLDAIVDDERPQCRAIARRASLQGPAESCGNELPCYEHRERE